MPAYLGPAGSLVEFKCSPTTLTVDRPSSSRRTMGGKVKVQQAKASRRVWGVDIATASPAQIASLMALMQGGTPPWVYVDPYAQVTNMYTPEQSVLMPGTWEGAGFLEVGAVTVAGLTLPRSVTHATGGTINFGYRENVRKSPAVVTGIKVFDSAYLRGVGNITLTWQDYSGASLGTVTQAYNHPTMARSSVSGVPPVGTASVHLSATGVLHAAGPAVTWTDALADWSLGRGCLSTVTEGLSEAVQMAVRTESVLRRSQITFTIREVG